MKDSSPSEGEVTRTSVIRRWLTRGAALGALIGALLIGCRAFFGWAFPVSSGSMEPTIMTGEHVFLRYDRDVPQRFDVVAFRQTEGGGAAIKRVFGLPGERFLIDRSGDVWTGRTSLALQKLKDSPGRPPLIPVFDSALKPLTDAWVPSSPDFDPWTGPSEGGEGVWTLDGRSVSRGDNSGLLVYHPQVTDGQMLPSGEFVAGIHTVHDLAVEFEMRIVQAAGRVRVQLMEEGDLFEASISTYASDPEWRALLLRQNDRTRASQIPYEYPAMGNLEAHAGEWVRVFFSNVDDRLRLEVGDDVVMADYRENEPSPLPAGPGTSIRPVDPEGRRSPAPRVRLGGGEGIVLEIRNVRVLRDFHVVPRLGYGVGVTVTLGPDELYVLGDASDSSRDSRDRGPVLRDRLIGRVDWVVWPFPSFRRL